MTSKLYKVKYTIKGGWKEWEIQAKANNPEAVGLKGIYSFPLSSFSPG
jgi:hypothetical protein